MAKISAWVVLVQEMAVRIFGMRISDSVAWAHAPATAYERLHEKSEITYV